MFLLEGGRMMTGVDGGLPRFDHALNAALMLSHVATRGGDRVGVLGFDDSVRVFMPPTGGAAAELLRWRESVVGSMKRAGAMVLEASGPQVTGEVITRYLEVKARHLL